MSLRQTLNQLQHALQSLKAHTDVTTKISLTDFKSQQRTALQTTVETALVTLEKQAQNNSALLMHISTFRTATTIDQKLALLETISELIAEEPHQTSGFQLPQLYFPNEIRDEMNADIHELKRCFDAECYRSAVILCGRILETALHRRYFDVAGNDLLEKSPGMGLGNLIARMEEKGIKLDPGLTNQIHLINQVRIYSVHKKQEPFNPTKTQAHAIILYTVDVLKKLFEK